MKYVLEFEFPDIPECNRCMLCRVVGRNLQGESVTGCAALGQMPKCPEEGCRCDCPLKRN